MTAPTKTKARQPIVPAGRRARSWRLSLSGVLVAIVAGVLSAGAASPAAAADACANAAARIQTGSTELPDCRGYEMVSAPYKEGFQASPVNVRFTDDGVLAYQSQGTFANNEGPVILNWYRATRSTASWATSSVSIPNSIYDIAESPVAALSADLRRSVWFVPRPNATFYFRAPDGSLTRIGDGETELGWLGVAGASPDLSHVLFTAGSTPLYEYVGTGNDGPPRTVSVDNHGDAQGPICFQSISPDGQTIVYSTACAGGSPLGTPQVWARIGGSVSVAVSRSECTRTSGDPGGACNGVSAATYAGGAVDGSRVFFTTIQQLVNGDTDTENDLYACDIPAGVPAPMGSANPCTTLTEVSGTTTNARVDNVVRVSEDGSRVYFVAQGVLADNLGVNGVAASTSVPNLYLWERDGAHPAGTTRFVTPLNSCAVPGEPCNDLWRPQTTPDGRYLLVQTANKLVTEGPGADTDEQADAYRYDAVTKTLVRVSTSVSGGDGNLAFPATLVERAMSADGSTVIFDTAEALSVRDTDGVTGVYAWRDDGRVSLISAKGGTSVGISRSGRDIFFGTSVQMVAADRDFLTDIYDARVDGGFAPVQTTPCSGDPCQGQHSQPPSLAAPSPPGSGDGLDAIEAPPSFSLRAVSAAQRRALAATGRTSLTVTTNAPGTVGVKATASVAGRSVTVGSARRTVSAPGRVAVTLTLSKKARSQLAARRKLTVNVVVSHSKVALDRSVTLRLVRGKAKAQRSTKRAQRSVVGVRGGRS